MSTFTSSSSDSNSNQFIPQLELEPTHSQTLSDSNSNLISSSPPIRPTINTIQNQIVSLKLQPEHAQISNSSIRSTLNTPNSDLQHPSTATSSSTVSRASSARSTSSVQAVPFRTPNRTISSKLSHSPRPLQPLTSHPINSSSQIHPQIATSSPHNQDSLNPTTNLQPPESDDYRFPALASLQIQSTHHSPLAPEPGIDSLIIPPPELVRGRSNQLDEFDPNLPHPFSTQLRTTSQTRKSIQDFQIGEILGEGSYSTVFHAIEKSGRGTEYAIKVLDKRHIQKEKKIKYVAVERDTLNRLERHPGCLRLFATFQDDSSLYYLLEYAAKGEILKVIKLFGSLSTDCARFYAAQILDAIEHMHSRGVIHRDLKPENILLDSQMRVKIADFGSAKILAQAEDGVEAEERSHSFVGTAEYVSPELLLHKTTCKSSDIWAFGCVLFQLLAGTPPFRCRSEYLTFQKITSLDYAFPPNFPKDAQSLITQLLVLDPDSRLGARIGLSEIKSHEFFSSINWSTIWTITPPTLETGILPPRPTSTPETLDNLLLPPLPNSLTSTPSKGSLM
ncbi:hypothetical protein CROQUDRAFT_715088 [Cronartium quercuum f. sp. fusiforme G11]|uniref:non-specific serine/threonine protein kinase n=1 Tax=Cronartium quercuum f. sp. fusiforme G11 TaxID=708437 RepID=A0A9P6TE59_9BASI|nr:hypothetical protein CROQUDRAFT_715088 [Cronartium quercuum f. sp. fusiforme G11]